MPAAVGLLLTAPCPTLAQKRETARDNLARASARLEKLDPSLHHPEERKRTASLLGLQEESSRFRSLQRGRSFWPEQDTPRVGGGQVILHLKGSSSHVLSRFEDVKSKIRYDRAAALTLAKRVIAERESAQRKALTLKPLNTCYKNETIKHRRKNARKATIPGKELFDFLFLSSEQDSLKIDWLYGTHTTPIIYDPSRPTPHAFTAKLLSVECLPTRIRITNDAIYLHTGNDALRNYEKRKKQGKKKS